MYTNSQMIAAIDEHVHSAWQREALKLRYIDGLTHEQIAEALGYSSRGYAYRTDPGVEPGRDMSYRGNYARGRRGAPRDSMGRYSGEMGCSRHGDAAEMLRDVMEQAPDEQTRRELERIAKRMEG